VYLVYDNSIGGPHHVLTLCEQNIALQWTFLMMLTTKIKPSHPFHTQ
jgi:hypothetical protein